MHPLLEVPFKDHLLSMGNFRGISLSKGWPLCLAISVCLLLQGRLSLHFCVCDRVLFSINKQFFQYCEKTSFWGKKIIFGKFLFFLDLLVWLVGATDTFVAEYVANMLS